jgi:hypothetical protein
MMRTFSRSGAVLAAALLSLPACSPPPLQTPPAATGFGLRAITGGLETIYPYTSAVFTTTQAGTIRWSSDTSNGLYTPGDGNTLTVTVTGSGIRLFGSRQARGCPAVPVTIDGAPYTLSCYNGGTTTPAFDQELLHVSGLTNTSHTVTITNPIRGKYVYLSRVAVQVPGAPIVRRHLFRAEPTTAAVIDQPDLDAVADHYAAFVCERTSPAAWGSAIQPVAAYLKARNPGIAVYASDSLHTSAAGDWHFTAADTGTYGPTTTLSGAITAAATTLTVADGSTFPIANFYVQVDGERLLVSGRVGNTLNVQLAPYNGRGIRTAAGPSPAAAHAAGAVVSLPHEDWFLHDNGNGSRLTNVSGIDTGFVMDIRNSGWVNELASSATATVGSDARFSGLLLTKAGLITGGSLQRVSGGAGTLPAGYLGATFTNAANLAMANVAAATGKPVGMSFSPNSGPIGAPNLSASFVLQDGVGHLTSSTDATLTPTASWNAQQAQWTTQQGSGLLTIAQGGTPGTGTANANRNLLYALGAYLLRTNGTDTFDFFSGGFGSYHPYYEATEVPLGSALGGSYADGTLQRRDFQNGVVLVNPSTVTSVPYAFGNTLFVLGNGAIGALSPNIPKVAATYTAQTNVTVAPGSAVIAVFATP